MPRVARFVCPGVPHHVTQRGNRRGQVFFSDADYRTYLAWLHFDARRYDVELLAYCLMSNHVHLVVVPRASNGLERALRHLHMRYAQRLNSQKRWKGHVWQGRYFSAPLDEPHFWAAIRYVERNPVRAGLVVRAEDYPWSSAPAHCEPRQDPLLSQDPVWIEKMNGVANWASWIATDDDSAAIERIRRFTGQGLPCGSRQFVETLEMRTGRSLMRRPSGRPRTLTK